MDHVEIRAWLDDAFFAPGELARLDEATEPLPIAVREHLAACVECTAHHDSIRRTALMLDLARGPSPATRESVLAAVRRVGRPRQAGGAAVSPRPWWRGALGMRLAAAALVVGVIGAGLGVVWSEATRPSTDDMDRLADAVAMMTDMTRDPDAHEMVLRDPAGNPAGMAVMSPTSHRLAVFTSALSKPAQGGYGCYLERAGQRSRIGPMLFADGVAFWAGGMDDSVDQQPGDQLVVAADEEQPAMLRAPF